MTTKRTTKRGPGRPRLPKGKATGAVLSVRLTPAELADVKEAAKREGQTVSEWAREMVVSGAAGTLAARAAPDGG